MYEYRNRDLKLNAFFIGIYRFFDSGIVDESEFVESKISAFTLTVLFKHFAIRVFHRVKAYIKQFTET